MILQVNKMYDPDIGGVETVVKEYANFLKTYEDIVVLCVNPKFSLRTKIETIDNVKVYRCASFGTFLSMPISIVFFVYLFFLSRKATVIHIHEPFPLASVGSFLISSKKKIFITWHSDIIKQKSVKKVIEFFQYNLCKKATKIISTSDRLINFSDILSKFRSKIATIPLSLNHGDYSLDEVIDEITLQNLPEEYVLFLGRFSYYKGIFVLLDAIELIDDNIPFVIAGNGDLSDSIKERITNSKKNIYFVDRFVTEEEKKLLLKKSKFMVFPSTYPSEAFGIIQLESMIYGKPVINTNLETGVPWVSVDNETGLTVEVSNSVDLAKAISNLYKDTNLYNKLSLGAKNRFNKLFSSEKTNKDLYNLYYNESNYG